MPMIPSEYESALHKLNTIFLEENGKLNLSAFRKEELSWVGNIMDSLAVLDTGLIDDPQTLSSQTTSIPRPLPPQEEGLGVEEYKKNNEETETEPFSILDLGTGGGFPLLPLALCRPDTQCTGLDATQKKIAAVERIAQQMKLQNVELIAGRAEELGHDNAHREQYDLVLSRAVAPINTLLEYCVPFAKEKGHIILWKSMTIEQELKDSLLARAELSCHLIKQHAYELPEKFGKRQLLIFEKTFKTPKKYPRETGTPKKNPLV